MQHKNYSFMMVSALKYHYNLVTARTLGVNSKQLTSRLM